MCSLGYCAQNQTRFLKQEATNASYICPSHGIKWFYEKTLFQKAATFPNLKCSKAKTSSREILQIVRQENLKAASSTAHPRATCPRNGWVQREKMEVMPLTSNIQHPGPVAFLSASWSRSGRNQPRGHFSSTDNHLKPTELAIQSIPGFYWHIIGNLKRSPILGAPFGNFKSPDVFKMMK